MACKLTYNGVRYDSREELINFLNETNKESVSYDTTFNGKGTSHMFKIGGDVIGSIRTRPTEGGEVIEGVTIKPAYQRQGIGTELYLETIRNLMIEGKKLKSDSSQTEGALKIWKSLVKNKLAVRLPNGRFETVTPPFKVTPSTSIDEVMDRLVTKYYTFENIVSDSSTRVESEKFGENVIDEVNTQREIPVIYYNGGEFTSGNIYPLVQLKNTILASNNRRFSIDATLLNNLDEVVWNENQEEVKDVLQTIERTLISNNIDVIGLSGLSENRKAVSEILNAVQGVLNAPTEIALTEFYNVKETYLPTFTPKVFTDNLPEKYDDYTIVSAEVNVSQDVLFEEQGLIKIANNYLYHKVDVSQTMEDLYIEMYERFKLGQLSIPERFLNTKGVDVYSDGMAPIVFEALQNYTRSRDVGFESRNTERISAYQILFNHDTLPAEVYPSIESIKTDTAYLKGQFVGDFYNYVLQEKYNNSDLYNSTLKYFTFTDMDINFQGIELNIEGMKYEQELRDYTSLKKDKGGLLPLVGTQMEVNEDLFVLNNPMSVTATPRYFEKNGIFITELSDDTYIRVENGGIARLVTQTPSNNVYSGIGVIPDNNIYFDTNLNFDINVDEVVRKYTTWKNENPNVTGITGNLQEQISKPRVVTEVTLQQAIGLEINPIGNKVKEEYDSCSL